MWFGGRLQRRLAGRPTAGGTGVTPGSARWRRGKCDALCAACSLGEIADPSGHEALLAVLNDRSLPDDVRCGAASGLGASGDGSYVERLTVLATEAGEARNVRAHAIEGVVRLQGQKAVPLLKSLVKKDTTDDGVRFSAAVPLVKLTSGAVDDLDTVYACEVPVLRKFCIRTKRGRMPCVALPNMAGLRKFARRRRWC